MNSHRKLIDKHQKKTVSANSSPSVTSFPSLKPIAKMNLFLPPLALGPEDPPVSQNKVPVKPAESKSAPTSPYLRPQTRFSRYHFIPSLNLHSTPKEPSQHDLEMQKILTQVLIYKRQSLAMLEEMYVMRKQLYFFACRDNADTPRTHKRNEAVEFNKLQISYTRIHRKKGEIEEVLTELETKKITHSMR